MSDHASWIDRRVVAKTGPGEVYAKGRVVAYTDAPTFTIETDTGARVHWRADLTELVIDEEQVKALADLISEAVDSGISVNATDGSLERFLVEQGVRVGGEPR